MRVRNVLNTRRSPGLTAFMIGGLVGGAIALLYAPRPGREMREQLMNQGQDRAYRVRQSLRGAQENLMSRIDNMRSGSGTNTMSSQTRRRIQDFRETARDMMEEDRRNVGMGTINTDE